MNEKVDVLAVMDAAINLRAAIYNAGRGSSCSDVTANRKANLDDAIAARAAIAELIEVAKAVHEQIDGPDYDGSCSQMAFDRLAAALARVVGA